MIGLMRGGLVVIEKSEDVGRLWMQSKELNDSLMKMEESLVLLEGSSKIVTHVYLG